MCCLHALLGPGLVSEALLRRPPLDVSFAPHLVWFACSTHATCLCTFLAGPVAGLPEPVACPRAKWLAPFQFMCGLADASGFSGDCKVCRCVAFRWRMARLSQQLVVGAVHVPTLGRVHTGPLLGFCHMVRALSPCIAGGVATMQLVRRPAQLHNCCRGTG